MEEVRRGEIWLVNLDPTIGHEIKKSRPAVIIQNDIGNKYSSLTIVAPVTAGNVKRVYPIEVLLTLENAGVEKPSKTLLNQIRAIDKQRLVKKLSRVNDETMEKVNDALRISLGLF